MKDSWVVGLDVASGYWVVFDKHSHSEGARNGSPFQNKTAAEDFADLLNFKERPRPSLADRRLSYTIITVISIILMLVLLSL